MIGTSKSPSGRNFSKRLPMDKEQPLVSIVIPHYLVYNCLETGVEDLFLQTTYPNFEVIISDDGTNQKENDEVLFELQKRYPIKLHSEKENHGLSYNINRGAELAKGKYIIIYSNDVRIKTPDWIEKMVNYMETHPEVGALTPKSIKSGGENYFVGTRKTSVGVKHIDYGKRRDRKTQETDSVNGVCLIISKELFDRVGGFDERYVGLGLEDVDFSYRIRELGYKLIYLSDVVLIHLEEVTTRATGKEDYLGGNLKLFKDRWCKPK